MTRNDFILTIASQAIEIAKLKKQNDELLDNQRRRQKWLSKAKEDAGYRSAISFDAIWAKALELLNADKKKNEKEHPLDIKNR